MLQKISDLAETNRLRATNVLNGGAARCAVRAGVAAQKAERELSQLAAFRQHEALRIGTIRAPLPSPDAALGGPCGRRPGHRSAKFLPTRLKGSIHFCPEWAGRVAPASQRPCSEPVPPASCTRRFTRTTPQKFTRAWFAWANTIFGELVLKTFNERPQLLN